MRSNLADSLDNPPLVELIAELRWGLPPGVAQNQAAGGVALPFLAGDGTPFEEFFMRFGGLAQQLGFTVIERLAPPHFPVIGFQPVFRFRPPAERGKQVLYQIGAGIFSANAVPPYKSWDDFLPILRDGIRALLQARAEKEAPFIVASVRYIDAFGPQFTRDLAVADFLQNKLGFHVELPKALSRQLAPRAKYKPFLQFQIPLAGEMLMTIGIGEGVANKQPSIIMDTTVATTRPVDAREDVVIDTLRAAQRPIHDSFIDMIEPIKHLMGKAAGS